jgi:RND family efflux transporter MFP subunit
MHIMDLSQVWVDAQIYEKDLAAVSAGGKITFTVPAYPGREFEGTVMFLNKTLDPVTRTVTMRSRLNNPDELLLPEMFGDVTVISGKESRVPVIPAAAVMKTDEFHWVMVPGHTKNEFERKQVTVGRTYDGWTEIKSGLREGEPVVSEGAFTLFAESQKGSFQSGHVH